MLTSNNFWVLGEKYIKYKHYSVTGLRRFKSYFGVSPEVCSISWNMLENEIPYGGEPKHLLWALMLLKQYNTENCNAANVGVDEKTFRKWSWIFIRMLANLPVVSL